MNKLKKKLREKLRVSPLTILEYYEYRRNNKEIPENRHPVFSNKKLNNLEKAEITKIIQWFDSVFPLSSVKDILNVLDVSNPEVLDRFNEWKVYKLYRNEKLSVTNIKIEGSIWSAQSDISITCKYCGVHGSSTDGSIKEFVKSSNTAIGFLSVCNSCNTLIKNNKDKPFTIVGPYSLLKDYKKCTECHKVVHKIKVVSEFRLYRSSGNIIEPISYFSSICKECEAKIKKNNKLKPKSVVRLNA